MTEPIIWDGSVLAYVIRGAMTPEKTVFPTPHPSWNYRLALWCIKRVA